MLVLCAHSLLRRVFVWFASQKALAETKFTIQKGHSDKHPASWRSSAQADIRLEQRMAFDIPFTLLFLCALHGFSAIKIGLILYINFLLAKRLPRGQVPAATWIFNICILFANELCQGYPFGWVIQTVTSHTGQKLSVVEGFARRLDAYGGIMPRWEILFNLTVLRLISFNLDYYWSTGAGETALIEV